VTAGSSEWAGALSPTFTHEALFYSGVGTQLAAICEFVSEGVSAGDGVIVMLSAPKIERLAGALGPEAKGLCFVATDGASENPAKLGPQWRNFVDSVESGRGRRGVCEPVCTDTADRSDTFVVESQIHESLLDFAVLDGASFRFLCTYDEALNEEVLGEARRSHQYVWGASERASVDDGGERSAGPGFFCSDGSWEAPGDAQRFDVNVESIGLARRALYEFAHAFGMTESAAADCALACHEVISNSLRHGGGEAHLSIWREEDTLICQVTDKGRFEAPLAGRKRPEKRGRTGRGLWITNQLCDLVQIRSVPDGTLVRLQMHR
jgi:anti-sigma regulatory factor (Ser/Thr protein kinase)